MIDALACEPHFLDHLAPLWRALPYVVRGRFLVDRPLVDRALRAGVVDVWPIDANTLRTTPQVKARIGGDRPALVASIGDIKVGRRMGYGPFAFLEHGAGQSYLGNGKRPGPLDASYAGGPDRDDVGLFLVPGPDPAARWRVAYPGARVEVIGSPRAEGLPGRVPGPGPVVAVSFHWPAPMSVSGYAGTAAGEYLPLLPKLAEQFQVIGHAHPKGDWPVRMARDYKRLGIEFVPEFEDVCRRADVYVCDNSSTIFEFAATGRPVVLLNSRYWDRRVEHGLRFWAASGVGENVWPTDDLVEATVRALVDGSHQQAQRDAALDLVYGVRHGAALAGAAAIVDWLGSLAVAA